MRVHYTEICERTGCVYPDRKAPPPRDPDAPTAVPSLASSTSHRNCASGNAFLSQSDILRTSGDLG